jgi:hypothetical protein
VLGVQRICNLFVTSKPLLLCVVLTFRPEAARSLLANYSRSFGALEHLRRPRVPQNLYSASLFSSPQTSNPPDQARDLQTKLWQAKCGLGVEARKSISSRLEIHNSLCALLFSLTNKRTEGRGSVRGSEFTTKVSPEGKI